MKTKSNLFLPVASMIITVSLSPLYAATIDTTGTTSDAPTVLVPGNTYIGDGFLNAQGAPGTDIGLEWSTDLAMTGGVFTIESGVEVTNGWGTDWTNNKADLQINGIFDIAANPPFDTRVDALTGAGAINFHSSPWENAQRLHIGLDNGSGTFSGTVQGIWPFSGSGVNIIKSGTGTQTFDNLANQPFRTILINEGDINLSTATDASFAANISGVGNLTKSGVGNLTLTGTLGNTGIITVNEGTLSTNGLGISASSNLIVQTGAVMNLNFSAPITVNSLELGNSGSLPVGIYSASHPTYGSYFTGGGSLRIQSAFEASDGTWTSITPGNWSDATKWSGGAIASGASQVATFSAAAGVAVTLDQNFTVGDLDFVSDGYSIIGTSHLSLEDGFGSSITVAPSAQATISVGISGTEFQKLGLGTLTLAGSNTYTGAATVGAGRLVIVNSFSGSSNFIVQTDSILECNFTTGTESLANGNLSGLGTFLKTGSSVLMLGASSQPQTIALESGSLIDVQQGAIRNEYGNSAWGGNLADLNVANGAIFDIWDGNTQVDAISGSGIINKGWEFDKTLTFGADHGSATFTGVISNIPNPGAGINGSANRGLFNLVKIGSGTQTFTGSTNFGGNLTVNAGILSLGDGTTNTSLSDAHSVTVATDAQMNLNFVGSDTVASVTLGGTTYTTPGATFGASNFPAFFTGTGTLAIPGSVSDYDSWATEKGVTGGPSDDDDNDGVSNREEHAFGLLPRDGSSVNPIVAQLNKAVGTFSYTRRKPSLGTNLTYSVWFSTDLATWSKDTGATEGTLIPSGDNETVPVTLSALAGNPLPGKLFIQVRAE